MTGDTVRETAPVLAPADAADGPGIDRAPVGHPGRPGRRGRPSRSGRPGTRIRTAWYVGCAAFGGQLIALLVWSWHLWTRFDLTADMATFSQAWQQIATGHLNPYETTFAWHYPHWGYPFYQSHLELMMWPLALLYWVWPHAVDLLVVQDLALAGAGLVAFRWALEHLDAHWPRARRVELPAAIALALLLVNPWTYWAASFDFHFQPLAVFFTLLCARDLWQGRRRGWIWAALVLACGDVATTYLIGLGLALVVAGGRRRRIPGAVLVAVALAWFGVVGLVHSGKGTSLPYNYAYLAHHPVTDGLAGALAIVAGGLSHPSTPLHVLWSRHPDIFKFIAGAGTLGVVSGIGFFVALVVLVPNALNSSPGFISDVAAFQALAAVLALVVGAVMVMTWVARRQVGTRRLAAVGAATSNVTGDAAAGRRRRRWVRRAPVTVALLLGLGAVAQVAVESAHWTPLARTTFARVGVSTASELGAVSAEVPTSDEVIVSQGVMGRFGARRFVYPFLDDFGDGQTVPLFGRTVYVVLVPQQGIETASVAGTDAAVGLMERLGARRIADRDGVIAFAWHVPDHRHRITFPPG